MSWFNDLVNRAAKKGVEQALAKAAQPGGVIETTVHDVLRDLALKNMRFAGERSPSQFVWDMAFHMMRTDRTMKAPEARDRSIAALGEFLRDEKIAFGAPAYAWDQDAAETLAREYETDHWERVA